MINYPIYPPTRSQIEGAHCSLCEELEDELAVARIYADYHPGVDVELEVTRAFLLPPVQIVSLYNCAPPF